MKTKTRRIGFLMILTLLLCLLAGHAAAASRYEAISENGIVLGSGGPAITSQYQGANILSVPVNNEATDWNAVMLNGGNYGIWVRILPPAPPAAGYYCTGAGAYTDGAFYKEDEPQKEEAREKADNSTETFVITHPFPVMEQDSTGMVLIPSVCNPANGYPYSQICWRFTNGTDVEYVYERYFFTAKHSSSQPFTLNARYVSAEWQTPMENANGVASAQRENGILSLYLDENANYGAPFGMEIQLSGPAAATFAEIIVKGEYYQAKRTDGVFHFNRWSNENQCTETLKLQCEPTGSVKSYSGCMVTWYGEDGKVLDYGMLDIYMIPEEHKPFTAYLPENWFPVAVKQMKIKNNMKNCGVEAVPSEGLITIQPSGKTPSGEAGEITYAVYPPKVDANGNPITVQLTYARVHSAGGEDCYGRSKAVPMMNESYELPSPKVLDSEGKMPIGFEDPVVRYHVKSVEVYLQQYYDPWGAGIWLINWYTGTEEPSANDVPAYSQYLVVETAQLFDFEREDPVALVNQESDITSPVQYTTLVKPASMAKGLDGWRLVARVDLQNGVDAYHRELYTINDTGAKNKLTLAKGETMVLYMPYPEGFAYGTEQVFTLYHYANSDYDETPETLIGTNTPYGIRYEVTSLSPFVHSWAEEEPETTPEVAADAPAAPPKAGDHTPLAMLAVMTVTAACIMGMLVWRRKRL